MRTETYCLPILITVKDDEPNKIAKKIADSIYDGINEILLSSDTKCERVEVEYSIFIKGKENEF